MMSSLKSKADVVVYKKFHQTYLNREFELLKEDYEIYLKCKLIKIGNIWIFFNFIHFYEFLVDELKLMLLPQWNDKIYTVGNDIYQSILLSTHEGDFLMHFINNQGIFYYNK